MIGRDEAARWAPTNSAVRLALSVTSARTAALPAGAYWCASDVDCFMLAGDSGVTAAIPASAASSVPLFAKLVRQIEITAANAYVAGIVATSTGNLFLWRHS